MTAYLHRSLDGQRRGYDSEGHLLCQNASRIIVYAALISAGYEVIQV